MGLVASAHVTAEIRHKLKHQERVRVMFAAAPSQKEMLHALVQEVGVDWQRVEAFHMDEYIGLPEDAPQNFRLWLRREFFDRVSRGEIFLIDPKGDPEQCAAEYAKKLIEAPLDIVCLGIGVNGHLAFNDPPADFEDGSDVKIVTLEPTSRQQQVDDGLFVRLEDVPEQAITVTIPRLMKAECLFCCVPGRSKESAVKKHYPKEFSLILPLPSCDFILIAPYILDSAGNLRKDLSKGILEDR